MKKKPLKIALNIGIIGLVITPPIAAGIPVWTFSAPSPASLIISQGQTATIQYIVTNQSTRAKRLMLKATSGLSASSCYLPTKNSICTLNLTVNGTLISSGGIYNGPVLCEEGNPHQCYQPSTNNKINITKINPLTTLTVPASAVIPVNNITGINITVHNSGAYPAFNVHADLSNTGWAGVESTTCPITNAGDDCVLTLRSTTSTPYVAQAGIAITGDNINAAPTIALAFRYQGGLVFSVSPNPNSIVKVVSEADVSNNVLWDANPGCGDLPSTCNTTNALDIYYGDNLANVSGSTNGGGSDGPGDTYQIFSVLNGQDGNSNTPANYAAAVCTTYAGNGFNDWYLPAICELGAYNSTFGGTDAGCSSTTQNIAVNLYNLGFLSSLSNTETYWSSTEYFIYPQLQIWTQYFTNNGSSSQDIDYKFSSRGVRCVRNFTL